MPTNLTSRIRDEWIRYEITVINARQVQHPELRAEAREAYCGGAAAMFRIFSEEVAQIGTPELQTAAVRELYDELRAFAREAGRK